MKMSVEFKEKEKVQKSIFGNVTDLKLDEMGFFVVYYGIDSASFTLYINVDCVRTVSVIYE